MQDFRLFQFISILKINFRKYHTLNVTLPTPLVKHCKDNFPFKWQAEAITYLGIQLPSRLQELYARNYLSVLQNIKEDLQKWDKPIFFGLEEQQF